jgi:hypothetical protein
VELLAHEARALARALLVLRALLTLLVDALLAELGLAVLVLLARGVHGRLAAGEAEREREATERGDEGREQGAEHRHERGA